MLHGHWPPIPQEKKSFICILLHGPCILVHAWLYSQAKLHTYFVLYLMSWQIFVRLDDEDQLETILLCLLEISSLISHLASLNSIRIQMKNAFCMFKKTSLCIHTTNSQAANHSMPSQVGQSGVVFVFLQWNDGNTTSLHVHKITTLDYITQRQKEEQYLPYIL